MARILIVDDNASNLKLGARLLQQAGYSVLTASDGLEGIRLSRELKPDMVLMDIQMPGLDGISALKRLRADAKTAKIKIVALTALAMKGDREKLLAEGFDGYLAKPIRYKAFLAAVMEMLGGGMGSGTVAAGRPESKRRTGRCHERT